MKQHHQKLLKNIFFIALLSQITTLDVKALSIDTTSTSTMTWAKEKAFDIQNTHTLYTGEFLKGNIKLNNGLWLAGDATIGINQNLDGRIFMNGYDLTLSEDLHLGNNSVIHGLNPSAIKGGTTVPLVPGYGRATIHLNHPLYIKSGSVRFRDDLHIDGHGNKIYVDSPTADINAQGSNIYFSNIILANVTSSAYMFQVTTITLDNVTLMVGSQINFFACYINCRNNVKFSGSSKSQIQFQGCVLTTKTESMTYFSPGCNIETREESFFISGPSSFNWESKSSILYLDNCSIYFNEDFSAHSSYYYAVTPWKTGTLILNGKVDLTTSQTSYPLTMGTGSVADDLDILYLSGSRLNLGNNIDLRIKNTN